MPGKLAEVHDLDYWLRYISSVHPREIELGLERIRIVAARMGVKKPAAKVVVIAGTNGKGSCITSMEAILQAAGKRVASYTSPHIHRYTERIRISGNEVDEAVLCAAFAHVESCRGEISLSYFEFSTLAALWIFCNEPLDVALLEIGLGGRLDAVNIIDGDVTVITSIGLDHQDWLGNSLDEIGIEKAGILRRHTPLVYGDEHPLKSILRQAEVMEVPVYLAGEQFSWDIQDDSGSWGWRGMLNNQQIVLERLAETKLLKRNVSLALQAIALLEIELEKDCLNTALNSLCLAGRQELRHDLKSALPVILDVAHNSAAAGVLAESLSRLKQLNPQLAQIAVVMAVMADKDIEGMAAALESCVDIWYIAQVEEPRCMPTEEAASRLEQNARVKRLFSQDSVLEAYDQACKASREFEVANPGKEAIVVVLGSFFTVAAVRELSKTTG